MRLAASVRTPNVAGTRSPHWRLNLYPGAGEAGGCLWVPRRWQDVPEVPADRDARDPGRAESEGARRARTKVRRYCASNGLNRLGTLTYAGEGCHDPRRLRADVAGFFKRLVKGLDGERLAYLWAGEDHPGGHGLHAHFAVGRFVHRTLIKEAWGHGFVHIKLLGNLPAGCGTLAEARLAARYLSKYVSKDLEDGRPAGLHRYEVAQGFQPDRVQLEGMSFDEVAAQACELMDHRTPEVVWISENEGEDGPPRCFLSWA